MAALQKVSVYIKILTVKMESPLFKHEKTPLSAAKIVLKFLLVKRK